MTDTIQATRRDADLSMLMFLDSLRRERPELFDGRAIDLIVDEVEDYAPRVTLRDGIRLNVQRYMSDVMPQNRRPLNPPTPREPPEEKKMRLKTQVAQDRAHLFATVDATTILGTKPLGDWTIGELRGLGGLFDFILGVAGKDDDGRLVRDVMTAKHWRVLRLKNKG